MNYSDLIIVKEVLRIDPADIESDTELTNCIASGDGLFDSILKFHGFKVPLSSPNSYGYVCAVGCGSLTQSIFIAIILAIH